MKYQIICSPYEEQRRDLLRNHGNGDLFTCEDIYVVCQLGAIAENCDLRLENVFVHSM